MRYLLVGNYGVGNLGDEMLREYFMKAYPEVEWRVVAGSSEAPRLPFGIRSLITTPWWKTLSALRQSEGMVFGGGTLFTDIESAKAPLLWWWHALWARLLRKKIILAFQGVGPFRTRAGEWCARWVITRAATVIVRDRESLRRASQWNKNCIQSFDPVFSLFHRQKHDERSKKLFIMIPRANSPESFLQWVKDLSEKKRGEWSRVRILSLEPGAPGERRICERLQNLMRAEIVSPRSRKELEAALVDASHVVTQRYHGAVAALALDIPCTAIPQSSGDKLASIGHIHRDEAVRLLKEGEAALRAVLSCQTEAVSGIIR